MKNTLVVLSLLVGFGACQSSSTKETPTNRDSLTVPDGVRISPDTSGGALAPVPWAGTYAGTLPCTDCQGIQTELTLAANGSYTLRRTYLGKADQKPVRESGTWQATDGPGGLVLNANEPDRRVEYRLDGGNSLRMLGRDGKEIDSKQPYTLTKK